VILEYPEPRTPGLITSPLFHFVPKMGVDPESNEARLLKIATSLGPSSLAFDKPKVRPEALSCLILAWAIILYLFYGGLGGLFAVSGV
jgi:hypothetical protein